MKSLIAIYIAATIAFGVGCNPSRQSGEHKGNANGYEKVKEVPATGSTLAQEIQEVKPHEFNLPAGEQVVSITPQYITTQFEWTWAIVTKDPKGVYRHYNYDRRQPKETVMAIFVPHHE